MNDAMKVGEIRLAEELFDSRARTRKGKTRMAEILMDNLNRDFKFDFSGGNHTFVLGSMCMGKTLVPSEGNRSAFQAFSCRFANIIVQANLALGNEPTPSSIIKSLNHIEPLLLKYGKYIIGNKAPEGWEKVFFQILDNLDTETLPFVLKDCNPECVALLQYCESTGFHDPVLDGLLSALKYDRSYLNKIVSSIIPFLLSELTFSVDEKK